eukprot:CAMPEP_0172822648 /NCGR_PEP_ID=MMETSP1075-20121228/16788_1 /TAXON_ID=2916 /ORGANISM="Ceratium fusus, Strain PA161109" /LENGTH=409 /DNA_ID=CAMNT_0013663657 /DNA_START=1 /DNA_END=1230 /DNA_ORIENTATION=+
MYAVTLFRKNINKMDWRTADHELNHSDLNRMNINKMDWRTRGIADKGDCSDAPNVNLCHAIRNQGCGPSDLKVLVENKEKTHACLATCPKKNYGDCGALCVRQLDLRENSCADPNLMREYNIFIQSSWAMINCSAASCPSYYHSSLQCAQLASVDMQGDFDKLAWSIWPKKCCEALVAPGLRYTCSQLHSLGNKVQLQIFKEVKDFENKFGGTLTNAVVRANDVTLLMLANATKKGYLRSKLLQVLEAKLESSEQKKRLYQVLISYHEKGASTRHFIEFLDHLTDMIGCATDQFRSDYLKVAICHTWKAWKKQRSRRLFVLSTEDRVKQMKTLDENCAEADSRSSRLYEVDMPAIPPHATWARSSMVIGTCASVALGLGLWATARIVQVFFRTAMKGPVEGLGSEAFVE